MNNPRRRGDREELVDALHAEEEERPDLQRVRAPQQRDRVLVGQPELLVVHKYISILVRTTTVYVLL